MRKVCYIAEDKHHLTRNPKRAMKGRLMQGKRIVMKISRADLNAIKEAAQHKFSYAQALYKNILADIQAGESGGSYLIDGTKLTPDMGGYTVGGTEQATYRVPELRLSPDEFNDPEDVAAAVELYSDEVAMMNRDGEVGVGFWVDGGEVCFDVFTWVFDLEEAMRLAFDERNEDAFYDIANGAEIINEKKLAMDDGHGLAFARYASRASRYRNASVSDDRAYIHQRWYVETTYKGFI